MPESKHYILKSTLFKFPTLKERKLAYSTYPKIRRIGFESTNDIVQVFNGTELPEVKKRKDLFLWDICLNNRMGDLYNTYCYLFTCFKKGVPDSTEDLNEENAINNYLFGYYVKIFYYFYIAVVDNIGQIINIYCDLNKKEWDVKFNLLPKQIKNKEIKRLIENFIPAIEKTNKYRNSFAHRFPINHPDYRPIISAKTYAAGTGTYIKPSKIIEDIKHSLLELEKFTNELRNLLISQ